MEGLPLEKILLWQVYRHQQHLYRNHNIYLLRYFCFVEDLIGEEHAKLGYLNLHSSQANIRLDHFVLLHYAYKSAVSYLLKKEIL